MGKWHFDILVAACLVLLSPPVVALAIGVKLVAPEGYVRRFVDESMPMLSLPQAQAAAEDTGREAAALASVRGYIVCSL